MCLSVAQVGLLAYQAAIDVHPEKQDCCKDKEEGSCFARSPAAPLPAETADLGAKDRKSSRDVSAWMVFVCLARFQVGDDRSLRVYETPIQESSPSVSGWYTNPPVLLIAHKLEGQRVFLKSPEIKLWVAEEEGIL